MRHDPEPWPKAARNRLPVLAGITFDKQGAPSTTLTAPVPLLLLLSRTDEYRRRIAGNDPDFDADPARMLVTHDLNRFKHYSRWFEAFAVDFITSEEKSNPTVDFIGKTGGEGFRGVFEHWLLPAIGRSRRPLRVNPLRAVRWYKRFWRSPVIATSIRYFLDPTFRQRWDDQR